MAPYLCNIHATTCEYCAAHHEHKKLRGNRNNETNQRQNENGNGELCDYGSEIRYRQRLPKENAAITTLAVESIETVEDAYDYGDTHDQDWGELVLISCSMRLPNPQRKRALHP
jgi:hypothetical protein